MFEGIVYRNKEAENREGLIEKILDRMRISHDGLCIFFATQDNQNKPDWMRQDYHEFYSYQGFYLDRTIDLYPNPWPDEIENYVLGKCYDHFIWISKRISESDDIYFAWILSHELQHFNQSLKNPSLLIVAELLHCLDSGKNNVKDLEIPTELECERTAKQIVISIFGEEKCNSYLRKIKEEADNPYDKMRYGKLLELNIIADFDVEKETQQVISIKRKSLKEIQERRKNSNSQTPNIDVDKLCSCKDPHEAIVSAVTRAD